MPRSMSFSHTTDQIRNRTKDVTRRKGWVQWGDELDTPNCSPSTCSPDPPVTRR